MRAQDAVTIAAAVLVPVVTAIAGVVSLLAQDRRVRRSRDGRRRLAFEDATRQVAFAAEWLKAKQLTASTPEALHDPATVANRWLDEAAARVSAAEQPPTGEEPYVSVSRLLLLYRLRRRSAKAIRICFYAALGFMGFVVIAMLNDAASRRTVGWNVSLLVLTGVLALLLRFWAVSTDSRDQN
ncbi:hypothetical protein [Streptomyces acidiscabies]|uniref:Uncharacterized protein n=1 Tax=Streptomyces acidiscabies TaxID=42234 RepID=A0AAP6EHW9_9ACTN|nr:hypothetical protein [Streptomyces acidiscabies]MBZ3913286.1 hypothetical protein [Streptomyces acidiscabies]MDX2963288.1 hypothetical protein [Streptomyces acidiscabies]MDX3021494.1 hypothetical protein [Streptomyces acidiscabies]MDX3790253.1 hypothetical protein [Streptomyces acidiscabies]GAV45718.1 hypothetical protein Saa2_08710 [Streptomyces acidiscabies]